MDKALISLNQRALPIYLVHGIEDNEVPILSADLAAEALAETNALTYLRLEGHGHDLNHVNIQSAACNWLRSILFGQESLGSSLIATTTQSPPPFPLDWKTDIASYIFSRGGGKVSVDTEAKKDTEGNYITDKKGNKQAVDFVSTGNNHHVAIYRDENGNLQRY